MLRSTEPDSALNTPQTAMVPRGRGKVLAATAIFGVVLVVTLSGNGPALLATADVTAAAERGSRHGQNRPRAVPAAESQPPPPPPPPPCPKPAAAAVPKWQGSSKIAVHCGVDLELGETLSPSSDHQTPCGLRTSP